MFQSLEQFSTGNTCPSYKTLTTPDIVLLAIVETWNMLVISGRVRGMYLLSESVVFRGEREENRAVLCPQ